MITLNILFSLGNMHLGVISNIFTDCCHQLLVDVLNIRIIKRWHITDSVNLISSFLSAVNPLSTMFIIFSTHTLHLRLFWGGGGGKLLIGRLSTSLKNGPNRIWQGSKKGGQLDWKLRKRESIGLDINTMRGQLDRAWLFEGFKDAEKGTQSDRKSQKRGSSPRNLPTMPRYGSTTPPPPLPPGSDSASFADTGSLTS